MNPVLKCLSGLILLTCQITATAGPVVAPPLPPAAAAQPIALPPDSTETIAVGAVVFRIATGTAIGSIYKLGSDKPLREDRWEIAAGRTREFDVAITDRLRQFGYSVLDPTQSAFETIEPDKAKFQLGGVVTRARRDYYFRYRGAYAFAPDDGYGISDLDVEFQILEQATAKIVFRKTYTGYGTEVGKNPRPLIPAYMNALDHALADPAFADTVRKIKASSQTPTTASSAAATLRIPACTTASGMRLPDNVDRVIPAVVTLHIGGVTGAGIVVSPSGYVLTAAHLVTGSTGVTAILPSGLEFDATVIRTDPVHDLAILQLPGRGHACVGVSESVTLKVGEDVFVVGSPLGKSFASSVSRGVLSGERTIDGLPYLQTDASVNPGNSGGPLLDRQGRVQGIVSSKIAAPGIEGLAFGVPISQFSKDLMVVFD